MIVEERMRTFINSLDPGNTGELEELEREAIAQRVPIIRREMQSLIKVLLAMKKPLRLLEIGTAIGFSSIFMCQYGGPDLHITTIENYGKRIPIARENIRRFGFEDRITLLEGDAADILPALREAGESYDMIFLDGPKGQYIHYLPILLDLLKEDALLLTDNVLKEGNLIESHYLVERRDRTIYKRMREYLFEIKHNPNLTTTILPVGDGAALSVRTSGK